jgi:hypothetical protein
VAHRRALPTLILGLACTTSLAAATSTSGCAQKPPSQIIYVETGAGGAAGQGGDDTSTGGADDGGGGGTPEAPGRMLFDALEDDFVAACDGCHDVGGIADMPFLAGPDRYHSVVSWPGFIGADPADSRLLTFPLTGTGHPGTNLDTPSLVNTLKPQLTAWITAEDAALTSTDGGAGPDAGPTITPFTPIIGFNAVYLDALGSDFQGMALTFTATELDSTTLSLTELQVHPTVAFGVHVTHPLFLVVAPDSTVDPDPADSFSNLDQTFDPGTSGDLGPGTLILTNWVHDGKLGVAFDTIVSTTPNDGGAGGGTATSGDCTSLSKFMSDAQPQLQTNCFSCHGGGNPDANGAIDMSQLSSDPAAACAQVKNRITPSDATNSQLFITTDPQGNAVHPFKFGGSENSWNNFKTALTPWIQAEQ